MLCSYCAINKNHKKSFDSTSIYFSRPLEILFYDVRTSTIYSFDGYKYYLIIMDHFTRYISLYPLKQKSQVADTFIHFKALVEMRFQTKTTSFYSDNGGEFFALTSFLSQNRISYLTTPPHTLQHNGISESHHRHVVETGLSLLSQTHMPIRYWFFAFTIVAYLINRMPNSAIFFYFFFHRIFHESPDYANL